MKTSTVLNTIALKFMSGVIIFLAWEANCNLKAVASSFKIQENNSYNFEELSYFSLKLGGDIYNQLEKEILKQESDFSDYIKLIENGLRIDRDRRQANPTLNIFIQSEVNREEQSLLSLLSSLKQLEFQEFSANQSYQTSIPVLPQVNYRNVYKDIYDFNINLTKSFQRNNSTISAPRTLARTQQLPENKYFDSYFQRNKNPNYSSFKSQPDNISNNNFYANDLGSSALIPSQRNSIVSNLTSLSVAGLSQANNQSEFSFLQDAIADINKQTYNQSYLGRNDDNLQIIDEIQPVYLPSTDMEIYQVNKIHVPSVLDSYKKPEYREELDRKLQKQKEKLEKQRQKMSEKLAKTREEREKKREKELADYRKQRKKQLVKAMKEWKKLQQQQQKQKF